MHHSSELWSACLAKRKRLFLLEFSFNHRVSLLFSLNAENNKCSLPSTSAIWLIFIQHFPTTLVLRALGWSPLGRAVARGRRKKCNFVKSAKWRNYAVPSAVRLTVGRFSAQSRFLRDEYSSNGSHQGAIRVPRGPSSDRRDTPPWLLMSSWEIIRPRGRQKSRYRNLPGCRPTVSNIGARKLSHDIEYYGRAASNQLLR